MTSMAKTILDHRMALFYSLQVLRAALQQTPYSYPMLSSHSCHLLASLSSQLPTDNSPMIPPVKSTLTAGLLDRSQHAYGVPDWISRSLLSTSYGFVGRSAMQYAFDLFRMTH